MSHLLDQVHTRILIKYILEYNVIKNTIGNWNQTYYLCTQTIHQIALSMLIWCCLTNVISIEIVFN